MNSRRTVTNGIFLFLLATLLVLAGCSSGSSGAAGLAEPDIISGTPGPGGSSDDISTLTEISSNSQTIAAATTSSRGQSQPGTDHWMAMVRPAA